VTHAVYVCDEVCHCGGVEFDDNLGVVIPSKRSSSKAICSAVTYKLLFAQRDVDNRFSDCSVGPAPGVLNVETVSLDLLNVDDGRAVILKPYSIWEDKVCGVCDGSFVVGDIENGGSDVIDLVLEVLELISELGSPGRDTHTVMILEGSDLKI